MANGLLYHRPTCTFMMGTFRGLMSRCGLLSRTPPFKPHLDSGRLASANQLGSDAMLDNWTGYESSPGLVPDLSQLLYRWAAFYFTMGTFYGLVSRCGLLSPIPSLEPHFGSGLLAANHPIWLWYHVQNLDRQGIKSVPALDSWAAVPLRYTPFYDGHQLIQY